ncbi:hypothetical protein FRB93_005259 [Tulasnella sp. JGI-2019a]|nr:hypothetical protein FRB93_005259 [Tulasnella sp. JGI-2019a]
MFATSIRPLWKRRHRTYFVLVITVCLLITSTANAGLFIGQGYSAFIKHGGSPGGVVDYYNGWSVFQPLSNFCLVAAVVNADVLLIFRLYMIWSRNRWVAVAPFILVLLECAAAIILCVMSAVPSEASYSSHHELHELAVILSGVCTVLVNVICTPMIVGRLWWVSRRGQARDSRSLYTVVIVRLIESGSLYTITLLVWIVFQVIPNNGVGLFTNYIFIMIIAISPMLIVLHLNSASSSETHAVELNIPGAPSPEGQGRGPHRSIGMVSTTIAFKRPTRSGQSDSQATDYSEKRGSGLWAQREADEEHELDGKSVVLDCSPGEDSDIIGVRQLSSVGTNPSR